MKLRGMRQPHSESGNALVEFALVLPVFMTLILGMFSGGLAYNHDNSLAHSAREAARYAATLPKGTGAGAPAAWTAAVSARAEEAAAGDLHAISSPQAGHFICVAIMTDATVDPSYQWQSPYTPAGTSPSCYADGLTTGKRVHVLVGRPDKLQLLVTTMNLNLRGKATTGFEDLTP